MDTFLRVIGTVILIIGIPAFIYGLIMNYLDGKKRDKEIQKLKDKIKRYEAREGWRL
jgi:hypothetical protein